MRIMRGESNGNNILLLFCYLYSLVENCLLWKIDSKNTLWFMERPEKFDLFSRPFEYFSVGSLPDCSGQQLFERIFLAAGPGERELPPLAVTGPAWVRTGNRRNWRRQHCTLRNTGIFTADRWRRPGCHNTVTSNICRADQEPTCLATFQVNQVYYGVEWRARLGAPSQFCFAVKHPQVQVRCRLTKYFCLDTEMVSDLPRLLLPMQCWSLGGRFIDTCFRSCTAG